jgi:hypothetical protein
MILGQTHYYTFPSDVLARQPGSINSVMETHLHPHHWDAEAIAMLGNQLPIICPESSAGHISNGGFRNVIALREKADRNGLSILSESPFESRLN